MSKLIIKETFVICPNCRRKKNANYTKKQTEIKVECVCGTKIVSSINTKVKN